MTDGIHQLVYISRATCAFDDAALDALARVATATNARHAVTGLLLHDGSGFIQALEGEQGAVERIMDRIASDPRHDSIAYVERRDVAVRQFGGWAMNVRRVHDMLDAQALVADVRNLLAKVDDHRLFAAFLGFVRLGRPGSRILGPPLDDGPRPAS